MLQRPRLTRTIPHRLVSIQLSLPGKVGEFKWVKVFKNGPRKICGRLVACTCNPASLKVEFRNGVDSILVGGNSPSIGGWIV